MGYKKTIAANTNLGGLAEVLPDIVYSRAGGVELKMHIVGPWWDREGVTPSYPTVLFVQGSGWTFPDVWAQMPQLGMLAARGYVVATITHRNAMEGHPFPACLQDVKTALRFLRAHAAEYAIDPERVGIWGTSSGGNLSLLTVMTEGNERYETEEWGGYSERADYCVACFPPADLVESEQDAGFDAELKDVFTALAAGRDPGEKMEVLREMSPCYVAEEWLRRGENPKLPPIFLAHGDADLLIPYRQSVDLCDKLEQLGVDVSFVTVEGAPHEGSFWGNELLGLIFEFINGHSNKGGK